MKPRPALPGAGPDALLRYPGTGPPWVFEHDLEHIRDGPLVQFRALGLPIPTPAEALAPGWGINATSRILDGPDQFARPSAASEVIQKFDVQRCVSIDAGDITPEGVAFELVRQRVQTGSLMVLEDIPTIFDGVSALDENGVAIFDYGGLNGSEPCLSELVHPDVLVTEPLRWTFALVWTDDPSTHANNTVEPNPGPVAPERAAGHHILPRWSDMRYGTDRIWGQHQQFLVSSSAIARYWVIITGPTDRFSVRVGARLGGFTQLGGRKGAALDSALIRRV